MSLLRQRKPRVESRAYLAFIRALPCIACACEGRTTYGCDPAHVSFIGSRGLGSKVDDALTVPLCRPHHDEQHGQNERVWWAQLGVRPQSLTKDLQECFPENTQTAERLILTYGTAPKLHRLVPASKIGETRDQAPMRVTITAHLSASGPDEHGNVAVHLPALGARGRATCTAFVDPSEVRPLPFIEPSAGKERP